jgi:hypothetical protein
MAEQHGHRVKINRPFVISQKMMAYQAVNENPEFFAKVDCRGKHPGHPVQTPAFRKITVAS